MCRNQHIGKSHQPRNLIVEYDHFREIFEKEVFFLGVNIHTQIPYAAFFECLYGGIGVDEFATARIDDHYPFFHHIQRIIVDDMFGFGGKRTVQRNNFRLLKYVLQGEVFHF